MTRPLVVSLIIFTLALPAAAATRMTYDINGKATSIEWNPAAFPLSYQVDRRLAQMNAALPSAIDRAFASWQAIPDSNIRFASAGVIDNAVRQNDGRVVVSLADDLFRGQGALALTTYTFDDRGRFTDADIQIDPSLLGGQYNVDMALRHEVGHLLGLDHSAVLTAVMYPFASKDDTATGLDSDDRLAMAAIYPRASTALAGATLQGRVMGDGGGIFAAQVVVVNEGGEPVVTALTSASGEFTLQGLPAGRYRMYAEPLDGPVNVSSLQGTWRQASAVSFPTEFYDGGMLSVESGKVYGNLMVSATGSVALNPRWVGKITLSDGNVSLTTTPVVVRAGETITLAVAGDGFTSGMTNFEVLNPAFRRISDFAWAANYVSATFAVSNDVQQTSGVILVHSGRDTASLTGAIRIQPGSASPSKSRAVRR